MKFQPMLESILESPVIKESGFTSPNVTKVLGAFEDALKEGGISKLLERLITEMATVARDTGIKRGDWKKVATALFSAVEKMKDAEKKRNVQFGV